MWRRLTWQIYFLFMPQRRSVKKSLFVGWVCFFFFFLSTALMIKLASSSLGLFTHKNKKATSNKFLVGGKIFVFFSFFFSFHCSSKTLLKDDFENWRRDQQKVFNFVGWKLFCLVLFFLPRCKFFQWKGWLTFLLSFFLSHKKTILAQPQKIGRDKRNDF